MILIYGGAYQGKLDFARAQYGLSEDEIQVCGAHTRALDGSKRCLAYVEKWALNCVRAGEDPLEAFKVREDAIVIATDISCGVVPMDGTLRAWREACGRLNAQIAARSEAVWRLFCGIPERLK